jgi:hypothetical protein
MILRLSPPVHGSTSFGDLRSRLLSPPHCSPSKGQYGIRCALFAYSYTCTHNLTPVRVCCGALQRCRLAPPPTSLPSCPIARCPSSTTRPQSFAGSGPCHFPPTSPRRRAYMHLWTALLLLTSAAPSPPTRLPFTRRPRPRPRLRRPPSHRPTMPCASRLTGQQSSTTVTAAVARSPPPSLMVPHLPSASGSRTSQTLPCGS